LGLPGLSGFISEALCFIGGFQKYKILTMIAASGVILNAAYLLWAMQRIFLGKLNEKYSTLEEIKMREVLSLLPMAAFVLVFGIYPLPILNLMGPTLEKIQMMIQPFVG
jgi:NADH-quinone oxidoreductase subunit M